MSCYLFKPGSCIFNILLPVILMSLFSFVTEAALCNGGFLEEPGGVLNKFKSLIHIRTIESKIETEKIKVLTQQLGPKDIRALAKRDIEMLGMKQLFQFFSPQQLVFFSEVQRSWSDDLRQSYERAEEIINSERDSLADHLLLQSKDIRK